MFIAEKFIYVELPKTATTTVNYWLDKNCIGSHQGKHNRPSVDLINDDISFIATIRNPWEWYLSLWSFGCKRKTKSGAYNAFTSWKPFALNHGFRVNRAAACAGMLTKLVKGSTVDFKANRAMYSDVEDPGKFRTWLRYILDKKNAWLLSSLYNYSAISKYAGHYSFQYCMLYGKDIEQLCSKQLKTYQALKDWDHKNCYIDQFMKVENLKDDFIRVIHELDASVTNESFESKVEKIRTNASRKNRDVNYFYDQASKDLVAQREQLIIEKFGYEMI